MRVVITLVILTVFMAACSRSEKGAEESESTTWAAMDAYHMVMADAYHPLKDSANLVPAREGSEGLALEAEKWASSELPDRVNNDDMKARLESLKASSRSFADKVKAGATDEELTPALTALHEEFHQIMEIWEGGGEGHKEHH